MNRPYSGLGRYVSLRTYLLCGILPPPPPSGWRYWNERDRSRLVLMPTWLYALVWLWDRRFAGHALAIRLGFLAGPEGGWYHEFRWTWRWWQTRLDRFAEGCGFLDQQSAFRLIMARLTWWDRLGWRIQRQVIEPAEQLRAKYRADLAGTPAGSWS